MSKTSNPKSVDTILLSIVVILVAAGFLIFSSASLGLLARDGATFGSVAFSQFAFGIIGGGIALFITSNIYYRHWRKYAFYIFLLSLIATAAVFIPGIGMSHGGATRWLDLGITSVQPSEFLKIGFIIYMAAFIYIIQPIKSGGRCKIYNDSKYYLDVAVQGRKQLRPWRNAWNGSSWRMDRNVH